MCVVWVQYLSKWTRFWQQSIEGTRYLGSKIVLHPGGCAITTQRIHSSDVSPDIRAGEGGREGGRGGQGGLLPTRRWTTRSHLSAPLVSFSQVRHAWGGFSLGPPFLSWVSVCLSMVLIRGSPVFDFFLHYSEGPLHNHAHSFNPARDRQTSRRLGVASHSLHNLSVLVSSVTQLFWLSSNPLQSNILPFI